MSDQKKLQFEDKALKFLLDNNEDIGGNGFDSIEINKILSKEDALTLIKENDDSCEFGIESTIALLDKNDSIELYDCIWNEEKMGYTPSLGLPTFILATKEGCFFTSGAPFLS